MPCSSTGAPGDKPRNEPLKYMTKVRISVSDGPHRTVLVRIEGERRIHRYGRRRVARQRLKCDAALEDGSQRFGAQLDSGGSDRHVDAACLPKTRTAGDEGVKGRIDEYLERDAGAARVQRVPHHLAYRDMPEKDRRTNAQGTQVVGMQHEFAPGQIPP